MLGANWYYDAYHNMERVDLDIDTSGIVITEIYEYVCFQCRLILV